MRKPIPAQSSILDRTQYFDEMAEGARFELAAHAVGAGFQDRWIKPLSHPSEM